MDGLYGRAKVSESLPIDLVVGLIMRDVGVYKIFVINSLFDLTKLDSCGILNLRSIRSFEYSFSMEL